MVVEDEFSNEMAEMFPGCYDGFIYTIDAQTGHIYWKFVTGAEIKSSPMVDMATGLVYVGSHRQCLYALNVEVQFQ